MSWNFCRNLRTFFIQWVKWWWNGAISKRHFVIDILASNSARVLCKGINHRRWQICDLDFDQTQFLWSCSKMSKTGPTIFCKGEGGGTLWFSLLCFRQIVSPCSSIMQQMFLLQICNSDHQGNQHPKNHHHKSHHYHQPDHNGWYCGHCQTLSNPDFVCRWSDCYWPSIWIINRIISTITIITTTTTFSIIIIIISYNHHDTT